MKVYIKNRQKLLKVNQQKTAGLLRKALQTLGLHKAELSILFVNDDRMKRLNRQYRGIDRTTDVLSFPQEDTFPFDGQGAGADIVLGDIVINLHKAERQAKENGLTLNEELKRLLVHGLLHLLGYDHEKSGYAERKMQERSKRLLKQLNAHGI
jgi:probable rRNA maturation factor